MTTISQFQRLGPPEKTSEELQRNAEKKIISDEELFGVYTTEDERYFLSAE